MPMTVELSWWYKRDSLLFHPAEAAEKMQELSYEEVIDTIENKRRFGNLTGVEISRVMLHKLGSPQKDIPFFHIAGTNGKGSVSAFLCSILKEAGLKVGMFTSPHLVDFRERIQVNGEMIPKEDCARIGNFLLEQDFGVYPTMFDYCMLMAVLYFREQKCDVMVMETGLGGRLDSTNALGVPEVAVITKIGYDHTSLLGDTLDKIAAEKAGIIKKGTTVVIESQEPEAEAVLKQAASLADEVKWVDAAKIKREGMTTKGQTFSYQYYKYISMHILGVHQYENAVAAMLAAETFLRKRNKMDMSYFCAGIEKAHWIGRMEILCENPLFMVDGAHNSHGVNALKESLMVLFPGEKFHFIMAVMADKDYEKMIEELLPLALDFRTITAESSRALQADALADCIRKKGIPAKNYASIEACFTEAYPDTHKRIAFGSLYFIGELEAKNVGQTLQKSYIFE